jgi:hypothetical protein
MFDSKKIIFEAKQTHSIKRKLFFLSKADTFDSKKIVVEGKRTH